MPRPDDSPDPTAGPRPGDPTDPSGDDPSSDSDDDWADAPDTWAESDRRWNETWEDDEDAEGLDSAPTAERPAERAPQGTALPPPPADYASRKATPGAVNDAYLDGMQAAGPYLGLGVQIAASMVLFAGGGYLVDRWLGTSPWGILIGAGIGMAGILALLVRITREADRQSARKKAARKP